MGQGTGWMFENKETDAGGMLQSVKVQKGKRAGLARGTEVAHDQRQLRREFYRFQVGDAKAAILTRAKGDIIGGLPRVPQTVEYNRGHWGLDLGYLSFGEPTDR
jgi:hypothetical protein